MVCIVSNFPTKVAAQQFEWAFQHPRRSRALRETTKGLWSSRGMSSKLKLLFIMLSTNPWSNWNLTLRFLNDEVKAAAQARGSNFDVVPQHIASSITVGSPSEHPMYQEALLQKQLAKEARKKAKKPKKAPSSPSAILATQPVGKDAEEGDEDDAEEDDSIIISLLSGGDEDEEDEYGLVQSEDEGERSFEESPDDGIEGEGAASSALDTTFGFENDEFGIAILPPLSQIAGVGASSSSGRLGEDLSLEERLKRRMAAEAAADNPADAKAPKRKRDDSQPAFALKSKKAKTTGVGAGAVAYESLDEEAGEQDDEMAASGQNAHSTGRLACELCKSQIYARADPECLDWEDHFVVVEDGISPGAFAEERKYVDCPACSATYHPSCAADYMIGAQSGKTTEGAKAAVLARQLIPSSAPCKCPNAGCAGTWVWPSMVHASKARTAKLVEEKRLELLKHRVTQARKAAADAVATGVPVRGVSVLPRKGGPASKR